MFETYPDYNRISTMQSVRIHLKFVILLCIAYLFLDVRVAHSQVDAFDDDTVVFENEDTTGNVADNDILPFGQTAIFTVIQGPERGTFEFTNGGNYIYSTPLNEFGFIDSVYYQVCVNGVCDIAGIGFYVIFRNTQPFANDDYISVELNTPRTADVTLNDGDPDSVTDPLSTELLWFKFTNPANGIVNSFSINGSFTYTPNAGFTGNDSFQYYVVDHCGLTEYATVFLTVLGNNLNPIATSTTINNLSEDINYTGSLQALASDPENDVLTFSVIEPPASGTLQLSSNGNFTYTPQPNFTGTINFTFNVCDVVGQCAQATATLVFINTDNDPPSLLTDNMITNEDTPATINVSLNDSDDSPLLTYSIFSQASNGAVSLISNTGIFNYTPSSNFGGTDSFIIQACDGINCSTSIVVVQVNDVNDAPSATPFVLNIQEDTNGSGTINTFTDIESPELLYSIVGNNSISGLTINSNGSYTYIAPPDYFGSQTINVQACDAQNLCTTSTFTLQVNAINDLPIAVNDALAGNEDQIITGNLSTGEYDIEGGSLTYSASYNGSNGILNLASNGQFTFTPNANWFGTQTIPIHVCDNQNGCSNTTLTLTVNSINDTPVALPANLSVNEDNNLTGNLSAFATDVETSQLTYTLLSTPSSGQISLNGNGSFTYSPAINFSGNITATYQACDVLGSCANGTIFINVNAVNDAPIAPNVSLTMTEDVPGSGTITTIQDVDNASVVITINQNAVNGVFTLSNSGYYTFTPNTNFFGSDVVNYTACDALNACSQGSINLTIQPVQDLPIVNNEATVIIQDNVLNGNLSANDSDGDGDVLQYSLTNMPANGTFNLSSNGSFIYTPNTSFVGTELINYQACDAQGNCANGVLTISVLTSNTAPVASSSSQTTPEDVVLNGNLYTSISDNEGGPYTLTTISTPQHGSLQWGNNGLFTYMPTANFFGTDSFVFQACDGGNLCSQATAIITVDPQNDAPILAEDFLFEFEDGMLEMSISENDSDIEGDDITYTLTSATSNGTAILTSDGLLTFTPIANFWGTVDLTYEACDAQGACSPGILSIYIAQIADAPIATGLSISTPEDISVGGNVSSNTTDVDSDILFFGTLTNPVFGIVDMSTDGSFTYSPASDYFGADQFIYFAADDFGMYDTAIIYIQISPINDAPIAISDTIQIQEDEGINFNISQNDLDAENDPLLYSLISEPTLGTASVSSSGDLIYNPAANASGLETIEVQICDAYNACIVSSVSIEIAAVNDLPVVTSLTMSGNEDETINVNLAPSASDVEDSQLQFEIIGTIEHGEWTMSTNGSFEFIPEANYHGSQTIQFTVCDSQGGCETGQLTILINSVNDAPSALNTSITLSEDSATQDTFNTLVSDADNEELIISITQYAQHGSFVSNDNGTFVYAPTANYFGPDSITYTACDANGECAEGTIYFEITFLNDLPIVNDESLQVLMNTSINGSLGANDEELDFEPLIYTIVEDMSGGAFMLNTDGTYSYTPGTDTTGLFSVSYSACDPCNACDYGIITFYVVSEEEANTAPTAMDFAGELCQGGSLIINLSNSIFDAEDASTNLQLTFGTANSGSYQLDAETQELIYQAGSFSAGQVIIPYYVCDNGVISMCDTASIVLNILPSNTISITGFFTQQISCFGAGDGVIIIEAQTSNGSLTYDWSNGGDASSIEQLEPGTYSVVLSSDAACPVNQTAQFEIFEPAELIATHEIVNDEFVLTITGGTPAYSIVWNTPSGIVLNETNLPINGEGTYTYTITDAHDCTYTESINITGINEINSLVADAYPNPISNKQPLTIRSSALITTVEIIDSKGAVVHREKSNSNNIIVNSSEWSSGIYLLRIHTEQGTLNRNIIKQ